MKMLWIFVCSCSFVLVLATAFIGADAAQNLTNRSLSDLLKLPPPSDQNNSSSPLENTTRANQTANRAFSFVLTLYNIDNSTGQVAIMGKAHNLTRFTIFNATKRDQNDGHLNGITDIPVRFQNATLRDGDEYRACVLVINQLKFVCNTSYKSPNARANYVGLSLKN